MIMADFYIKDNSKHTLEELKEKCVKALESCGLIAEGYAKLEAPADTGALRNSITHIVDEEDLAVYVGTNMDYASYVEFGTGIYYDEGGRQSPWVYQDEAGHFHITQGQRAQPYIRPSISDHREEYEEIITNILKE